MAHKIRKRIAPLARRIPLDRLMAWSGQNVVFPLYHVVSSWHLPHIRHLYRYRREDEFKQDLEELLGWFEPVSLSDYLEKKELGGSAKHSKPRMVLTFDDGLVECHEAIAPLLKEKGIPAAFFLNNYFIDNQDLFFRYKASLIIDRIISDCTARENASAYLHIPEEQLAQAVLMISFEQQALIDKLAREVELDFPEYLIEHPVYMSTQQVKQIVEWGFEIGGHSREHADFSTLEPAEMINQVVASIVDIRQRFGVTSRHFSFPFTSKGVPKEVIKTLLDQNGIDSLLGTAGLKKTGIPGFIQRIPMEEFEIPALDALKTEYCYYLLKAPLGRNTLRH